MNRSMPVHASWDQFQVADGELKVGGIGLSRLTARVGGTPYYAYDRELIGRGISRLRGVLPKRLKLHYAMKANPMPALVCHMAALVDGIDVASAGEMKVALDSGVDPRDISFAGPGKTDAELRQAVAAGMLVNIESPREVSILCEASAQLGIPARVAVRVNPDFEIKASGMKMGGGAKQFGVDAELVPSLLDSIGRFDLAFEGFHLFCGSQSLRPEAIIDAQRKSYELALKLASSAPTPVKHLNLGGGFGVPYFPGERRLDVSEIGENLEEIAARAAGDFPGADIVIELGRYLVCEAGVYVCSVLDKKVSRGKVFLVTNGGLHHHLSASGNFGQVIRKNYPCAIGSRMNSPASQVATVVGPLCTPLDLLADSMPLAEAEPGDLVVIFQSGAYGATASPQGFLGHPAVREVLV